MVTSLPYVCLLLFLPICTSAYECDTEVPCFSHRPREKNGCCPLPKGAECDTPGPLRCDDELGYSCINGLCLGKFNLSAVETGISHIELTWTDFLPENYLLEYSVMFTTNFDKDLHTWEKHEFGIEPHVTLRYLKPDQWYYIRVGVWDDPDSFTFQNITETLLVKTKASGHCSYYGSQVAVGETIVIECMESCTCLSTGEFRCVSVCPSSGTDLPLCMDFVGTEEECCELVEHCLTATNCSYQGDKFVHGESWLIDCVENCTCTGGAVTCVAVCGTVDPVNCLEDNFRGTNPECCKKYLECMKTDGPTHATSGERLGLTHPDKTPEKTDIEENKHPETFNSTKHVTESTLTPSGSKINRNETVSFAAEKVASTFAVLRWSVPYSVGFRKRSLMVKYRALSEYVWTYTKPVRPDDTQCIVKCLRFLSWYIAELVTVNDSKTIAITFFNTSRQIDSTEQQLRPKITVSDLKPTSVYIIWDRNILLNNSDILYTEIFWTKGVNYDDSGVLQKCVDKNISAILVDGLSAETMYVLWIAVILTDSRVVYSNRVHFVTNTVISEPSTSFHEHSKIIAIAISCTSVVILFLTFISVVYVVKYRRRLSIRRTETAFENKIFQIH